MIVTRSRGKRSKNVTTSRGKRSKNVTTLLLVHCFFVNKQLPHFLQEFKLLMLVNWPRFRRDLMLWLELELELGLVLLVHRR